MKTFAKLMTETLFYWHCSDCNAVSGTSYVTASQAKRERDKHNSEFHEEAITKELLG